jgi:predicted nucleic acid-binding protein
MTARPFLDTNVLIYAFAKDDRRTGRARELIAAGGRLSVQVLNEFVNVSRRKLQRDWSDIGTFLTLVRGRVEEPSPITGETHRVALSLAERHRLPFYDSLIIASAKLAGCSLLYSEDFQHGRSLEGVRIVNPFLKPAS